MDFAAFKKEIYKRFGLYLEGYKEPQLKRRIDSLMASLNVQDYASYLRLLSQDKGCWHLFIDKVTINVTEFFRNPEIFAQLEKEIIPDLLQRFKTLKIWSAACADGSEPYSVAIILQDIDPRGRHLIEATDIDPDALESARSGLYPAKALQAVSHERLQKYFRPVGDKFQIDERIKKMVRFRLHDLLKDPYGKGYHLILCRNVMIYFTPDVQRDIYRRFYESLHPGGVLFIGATETMFYYRELGYIREAAWFYRRP